VEDLNSRFEFENNHYKRSISTLKKIPEIMKEHEDNKTKEKVYDKTSDNEKERILKLIYYHKVNFFLKIYLSDLIFKFGMFKSAMHQSSKNRLIITLKKKLPHNIVFVFKMLIALYYGFISSFFSLFSTGL